MELLDGFGFDGVPVPFYEVSPFSVGLHRATAGVHREGTLEEYASQVRGF
jgi:glycine amidinotransferase